MDIWIWLTGLIRRIWENTTYIMVVTVRNWVKARDHKVKVKGHKVKAHKVKDMGMQLLVPFKVQEQRN